MSRYEATARYSAKYILIGKMLQQLKHLRDRKPLLHIQYCFFATLLSSSCLTSNKNLMRCPGCVLLPNSLIPSTCEDDKELNTEVWARAWLLELS